MSEDWIKIIKEKLESYEAPAPDGVWERVEASLFPEKTRKARIMPWWAWSLAAAAAVALGVFAGVRLIDRGRGADIITDESLIAESPASPETTISSSVDNGGGQGSSVSEPIHVIPAPRGSVLADAIIPDEPVVPAVEAVPVEETVPDVAVIPVEEVIVPVEEVVVPVEEAVVPVVVEEKSEANVEEKIEAKDTGFKTDHDGEDWSGYMSAINEKMKKRPNSPSAGISLSSAARESQGATTLDAGTFFQGYAANADNTRLMTRALSSIVTKTVSIPVNKEESHRRPVRLALSLDFPVSKALSVESGVTYSILQSVFSTSSGTRVSEQTQTLGYLGVPLNLKANLWNTDLFTVYTSGGGMVEKCLSARTKTAVSVNGERTGSVERGSFSLKPLYWSVNAGAGLQVNLPGNLGIYAEPGVSYHFDNGSQVKSVYTERPFDFVMAFGARYSFR